MERLYCPDFSSVFSSEFANPFLLPNVDSQIWPIFMDYEFPFQISNLIEQNTDGQTHFYHRKITSIQQKLELQSSSVQMGLLQALEIDSKYAISNDFVIKVAKKFNNCWVVISVSSEDEPVQMGAPPDPVFRGDVHPVARHHGAHLPRPVRLGPAAGGDPAAGQEVGG